jgi:hypothetical protein
MSFGSILGEEASLLSLCGRMSIYSISERGRKFAQSLWEDVNLLNLWLKMSFSQSLLENFSSFSLFEGFHFAQSEEGCNFARSLRKVAILLNLWGKMTVCSVSVEGCHFAQSLQADVSLLSLCGRMSLHAVYSISEGGLMSVGGC